MSIANRRKTNKSSPNGFHNVSQIPYSPIDVALTPETLQNASEISSNSGIAPNMDSQRTFVLEKDIEIQISKYFDAFKFILLVFFILDVWLVITSDIFYIYVAIDVFSILMAIYGLYLRSGGHVKLFVWLNFALWTSVNIYLIIVATRIQGSMALIHYLTYSLMFGFVYNVLRFAIWIDASKLKNLLSPQTSQDIGTKKLNRENNKPDIQLDEISWK